MKGKNNFGDTSTFMDAHCLEGIVAKRVDVIYSEIDKCCSLLDQTAFYYI